MQAQKLTFRLLSGQQEPIAKQIWGSEDEAEIARKQKQWALARQKQHDDRNRVFSLKDVAKVALITFISREILHRLGISVRKVALPVLLAALAKALYSIRAPRRNFPPNDVPYLPFFGQIGVIKQFIEEGGARMQIRRAKNNNFTTDEMCMFANPRDMGLFDPRDREHMLKTNWTNYAKNYTDGSGFQENFAEVLGRGIFVSSKPHNPLLELTP